jgi:MFS family permease
MQSAATSTWQVLSYLVSAAVGDLAVPALAVFLPLLTLAVGGNFLEVGIVGGISYVSYSFLPYLMGRYSDRFHSKHLMLAGSFAITTCTSLVYAFATSPVEIIIARAIEGVGWSMLWPTLQSVIATASIDKNRGLSVYNSVWSAAYAVGPILAGLFATIGSLRIVFILTSVILSVGLLVNLRFANSRSVPSSEEISFVSEKTDNSTITSTGLSRSTFGITFYFFALLISAFTISIMLTFFPPVGELNGISVFAISVITSGYGLFRFLFFALTTNKSYRNRLFARAKSEYLIALIVLGIAGASASLVVFDRNPTPSFFAFAAIGAAYSIVSTIAQSKIIAEAELLRTGEAAGVFEISIGIGTFLGPTIAGILSQFVGISPFLTPAFGVSIFVIYSLSKILHERK